MHAIWLAHLKNYHATVKDHYVAHFGDIPAELKDTQAGATIMADLSHYGLIQFSGSDAQSFLQSQLSCDVKEINPQKAQYGSYCTPKGRILASFLLWQKGEDYLMQLPASLGASIQKRLSLYVLRAKVQVTDAGDTIVRIGIRGQNAAELIGEITGLKLNSNQPMSVVHGENISILCLSQHRMELIIPIEDASIIWKHLARYARPVGAACWDWLDIQSGIPVILPETQEAFLPQMVNLDAIGGVSFKKGCYPGQEIVARTQYLGKLKRRMFLAHISTDEAVKAGDELYSIDMNDQSSGRIVNAVPSPNGGFDVLTVIQQSSVDAHQIHWQSLNGPVLEIKRLPYSLNA